jgi:threonine/homoserine/homoserine lactone efflux protein
LTFTDDVLIFLITVVFISTTGVMMPGPVTAATIAKGYKQKWAGGWIALGHGAVEFPTIALMALGFSTVLNNLWVAVAIGLAGGSMLIYMGVSMMSSREGVVAKLKEVTKDKDSSEKKEPKEKKEGDKGDPFPYHPFTAGVITTASNPYYFLWWATLGAALTLNALEFGLVILLVFAVLHWSVDLGWDIFIGYIVNRGKRYFDKRFFIITFAICGLIMILFGIWFIGSAVINALLT